MMTKVEKINKNKIETEKLTTKTEYILLVFVVQPSLTLYDETSCTQRWMHAYTYTLYM